MTFTIKYGAYTQVGYDGTLCDVTEPIWSVSIVITQLFVAERAICRPKLFGYGGLSLFYATPCLVFTILSVSRLKRMMEAHRLLWNDMANNVRFARPPAPSLPVKHTHLTPTRGSDVDDGSPNSSYHLVQLHTPPGLDISGSPSRPSHNQIQPHPAVASNSGLDYSGTADDSSVIMHVYTKSRSLSSTCNADAESHTGPPPPAIDGDVSSYGTAPSESPSLFG